MPNSWGCPKLELKPEEIDIILTQEISKEITDAITEYENGKLV